ncbi:hypothetical protein D3C86_2213730 [compost metagenome]
MFARLTQRMLAAFRTWAAQGSARKWKTLGVRAHGAACSVRAHSRFAIAALACRK